MRVEDHDGRTIADTHALAAVTSRPPETIRALCARGQHGYDLDHAVNALDGQPDPILLTIPEAHRYLGIPLSTLAMRVRRWRLRPVGRRGDTGPDLYPLDALTSRNKPP